jgi:hypothetical protein
MNWEKLDVVTLARAMGVLIVIGGIALSAWNALDYPSGVFVETSQKVQIFLEGTMRHGGIGLLVIVGAEIADRLGLRRGFTGNGA